jgi:hypothetical protein
MAVRLQGRAGASSTLSDGRVAPYGQSSTLSDGRVGPYRPIHHFAADTIYLCTAIWDQDIILPQTPYMCVC